MTERTDNDPRAITPDEGLAHGTGSDCPKCGAPGEYEKTEFGDDESWQDASCENGHAWREISRFVAIVALDPDTLAEVGAPVPSGYAHLLAREYANAALLDQREAEQEQAEYEDRIDADSEALGRDLRKGL